MPESPFCRSRTIERVPPKAVVPYLNERMRYQFQWGYRKEGRSPAEYRELAKDELRPVHKRIRGELGFAAEPDAIVSY